MLAGLFQSCAFRWKPMLKAFSRVLLGFLTDQPVEGAERCGGSAAKCNDDLLIGNGRAVAAGENARRPRFRPTW